MAAQGKPPQESLRKFRVTVSKMVTDVWTVIAEDAEEATEQWFGGTQDVSFIDSEEVETVEDLGLVENAGAA
jgi:hypothetical protein